MSEEEEETIDLSSSGFLEEAFDPRRIEATRVAHALQDLTLGLRPLLAKADFTNTGPCYAHCQKQQVSNSSDENDAAVQLRACGRCHLKQYCSRDCQKAHWRQHKITCQERPSPAKADRMARDFVQSLREQLHENNNNNTVSIASVPKLMEAMETVGNDTVFLTWQSTNTACTKSWSLCFVKKPIIPTVSTTRYRQFRRGRNT